MLGGAAFIFFAYIGFDTVATAAEEAKNPKRDLPIGILASLLVCTVLYIIVVAILTGMVPFTKLNVPSPVAFAMDQVGLGWASAIISIGAIAGLTTVLLTQMFGQTRIFYAMSRDRLLPSAFSKIHPKFRTPGLITIVTTLFIATVGSLTPIDFVGSLTNMGTLAAFILVSVALPILRKRYPNVGGFQVPFGPYLIPTLSAIGALGLMFSLAFGSPKFLGIPVPWFGFVVWLLIGFVVYFAYSRKNSAVGRDESTSAA
jgi:APA family basic amino acid/polyamine antiporter